MNGVGAFVHPLLFGSCRPTLEPLGLAQVTRQAPVVPHARIRAGQECGTRLGAAPLSCAASRITHVPLRAHFAHVDVELHTGFLPAREGRGQGVALGGEGGLGLAVSPPVRSQAGRPVLVALCPATLSASCVVSTGHRTILLAGCRPQYADPPVNDLWPVGPRRALDSTEGERGQIRRAGTTQSYSRPVRVLGLLAAPDGRVTPMGLRRPAL
jgi:hypothetical protein